MNVKGVMLATCILLIMVCIILAAANINLVLTLLSLICAIPITLVLLSLTRAFNTGYLMEENADLEDAIETTENLINEAADSFKIFTGYFDETFFSSKRVANALKKAQKRGVKIEIILGNPDAKTKSDFYNQLRKSGIYLAKLKKGKQPHFMVVDDQHIRLEEPHAKIIEHPENLELRAEVHYFSSAAKHYSRKFDSLKLSAVPI